MKYHIFIFVMAIVFLLSCKDKGDKVEPPICFVSGMVIDSLTRVAIDSAWIDTDSLVPYWTYTDSSGIFLTGAVGWPGKQIPLFCGKRGYFTKEKSYRTTSPDTAIVNFELVPEGAK